MRPHKGFTLLEVLIATLLVGISLFSIMELFNRGIFATGDARDYLLATSLTQEKLEELTNTSFSNVQSLDKNPVDGFARFERQVDVASVDANLKRVTVTSFWNVPNGEANVSLVTYKANS